MENHNAIPVIARQLKLTSEVEAIAKSRKLGPRLQPEVDEHLDCLRQACKAIEALHGIFDLSELDLELRGRIANLQFWRDLEAGRYGTITNAAEPTEEQSRRSAIFRQLHTTHSITLNTLYKASLDFKGITKPSPQDLKFAHELGENFKELKKTWEIFKRVHMTNKPVRIKNFYAFSFGRKFFELLKRNELIKNYALYMEHEDGTKEAMEKLPKKESIKEKDSLLIEYEEIDTSRVSLITGLWFEAFTYKVFEQTLDRSGAPYEIYNRVEFEAKELLKSRTARSDFDVLVGLEDQIIMAECKSGQITREDISKMIENSALLKRIFQRMNVHKFLFMLVFSPTDEVEQEPLLEELVKADFVIVEPYNIGGFINSHIQGIPPQDNLVWSPKKHATKCEAP